MTRRNISCIDDLSKQKGSPVVSLFDVNLTTALKDEHSEGSKGTWAVMKFLIIAQHNYF